MIAKLEYDDTVIYVSPPMHWLIKIYCQEYQVSVLCTYGRTLRRAEPLADNINQSPRRTNVVIQICFVKSCFGHNMNVFSLTVKESTNYHSGTYLPSSFHPIKW